MEGGVVSAEKRLKVSGRFYVTRERKLLPKALFSRDLPKILLVLALKLNPLIPLLYTP